MNWNSPQSHATPRGETAARAPLSHSRPALATPRRAATEQAGMAQPAPWVRWLTRLLATGLVLAALGLLAVALGLFDRGPDRSAPVTGAIPATYDSQRAFGYLKQLCELGPRPTGSEAMQRQQAMLVEFFRQQGAEVEFQRRDIRHPETGETVTMANLVARWYPERPKRFLFCAHYDTRPFPDRDPQDPTGTFVGANDGASGTAALMELSHQLADLPPNLGVDVVLFDAEEFVFDEARDDYFLGSTYFAQVYRANPPEVPYTAGVLLDMVGDRELKIYYERNSLRYAPEVAHSIWNTAEELGVRAFVPRSRHEILDDHIPLNRIAGIPTVDVIDFDYPRPGIGAPSYWHTEQDIPANCSGKSLAAVVWVVHRWLLAQQ